MSLAVALHVVSKQGKGEYRLTWVFLILLFPLFGGLFYLLMHFQTRPSRFQRRTDLIAKRAKPLFFLPGDRLDEACAVAPQHAEKIRYLQNTAGFPVYGHTTATYLTPGEAKFECLMKELVKAEKYIFLEYFIISEGIMWDAVLEVLEQKVKQGVDVRLMYDDMGCFLKLPAKYSRKLKDMGIKTVVFNPFTPILTATQNNRDHRKIAVIDGKVAFTGGINLADEYINAVDRFGHWKDASIVLYGESAWSFTLMFLQMWWLCTGENEDAEKFYPWKTAPCEIPDDGFVLPYADAPMDGENVGEHAYIQIINGAKKYLYINTPYLILDESLMSALMLAAKSGVDVRIVTPHRWDKRIVHITTRSYYMQLIESGVKIYEYTDGFMHSKTFVSDDEIATVGTTNLDFRSLYLHYECGVWMYKNSAISDVYDDFLVTLEKCQQITEEDVKCGAFMRLFQSILRLFAPLM